MPFHHWTGSIASLVTALIWGTLGCELADAPRSVEMITMTLESVEGQPRAAFLEWIDSTGIGFGVAMAPIAGGTSVAVLDMTDGTVRFQLDDSLVTVGAKGSGPGEVARPRGIAVRGTTIAILDLAGRIVLFDIGAPDQYRQLNQIISTPYPSLAVLSDGSLVIPSNEYPGFFGTRIATNESVEPWGHAPDDPANEPFTLNLVRAVGQQVAVFDNTRGLLLFHSPAGQPLDSVALPRGIRDEIDEGLAQMRASGTDVVGNPYVIGMHEIGEERIFLRLTPLEGGPVGAIARVGGGIEAVLRAEGLRADDRSILRSARSLVLLSSSLFALTVNEVYEFRIRQNE